MSRCLITGHMGFIGAKLYKKLQDLGHEVIGIDIKAGRDINFDLNPGIYGNDFHPYYLNFNPEYIFHLACIPRVGYSVENPLETTKNNILCTTNILNFAKFTKVKRVIFSSSSSVVGDGKEPLSPYALQKLYSEMECKLWSKIYGIDTVSLRYFNVYSEDQKYDGPYTTAIANWMQSIREPKEAYLNGSGEQRRDMVHVSDVIDANIFAMDYQGAFNGEHYDVGTGANISLNEIVKIIQEIFPDFKVTNMPERKGDVLYTKADVEKLQKINWKSKIKIEDGIRNCFLQLKQELKGD